MEERKEGKEEKRGDAAKHKPHTFLKKNRKNDDDDDVAATTKYHSKFGSSNISISTMDLYDPYEYREESQMGHLSNLMAWAHMVKCSFGTGVLTMPKGFSHAGMIPGLVLGIGVGSFCVFCMHILIKSCVHIAARERQPYIPFNETMKYTFLHGYPACKPVAKFIKAFTDFVIVGYHFGICITYINYLGQSSLQFFGEGHHAETYNWKNALSIFAWIPFLSALSMIRNLKWLAPVSMVGNILTGLSMGIIVYFIFTPDDKGSYLSAEWYYWGDIFTIPVYIGIILFAVEAFGVIIAVERDMKNPRKFLGWFGVFNQAMILVLTWYIFLGVVGYLRYGTEVKSTISLTIPDSPVATVMKAFLALALYCSYPLHLFVCVDIVWSQRILPKIQNPENPKSFLFEYLFRFASICMSGLIAFAIPQLDLMVSLIGAVCLSFLGIMMPGIMEYNVAWSKYGNQWSPTMVKDLGIAVLGGFAFVLGSYGALYGLLFPEKPSNDKNSTFF